MPIFEKALIVFYVESEIDGSTSVGVDMRCHPEFIDVAIRMLEFMKTDVQDSSKPKVH